MADADVLFAAHRDRVFRYLSADGNDVRKAEATAAVKQNGRARPGGSPFIKAAASESGGRTSPPRPVRPLRIKPVH